MTRDQREQLVAAALNARGHAYARYSNFRVGAAVLTAAGNVLAGANVENASYGLTICAERVAVSSAVSAGFRQFEAIAIATPAGDAPCGACRQFLAEFCDDLLVLLIQSDSAQVSEVQLRDLLPRQFRLP